MTKSLLLFVALTCTSAVTNAQSASAGGPPPAADLQRAAGAFARQDWAEARAAYEAIATRYPNHALSRFRVGVAQLELGSFHDAETNLRAGERLGVPSGQAAYRLAQLFAMRHDVDSAFSELRRAASSGLTIPPQSLASDAHFEALKNQPDWKVTLAAFDAVVFPCRHDERFRQFDFWVGDWDVRPTGQPAVGPPARNTVTLDDNDCVVTEHWSAPSGSVGQSFNIFDRSYGQWRQTWVDNVAGQHDYRGRLVDGNMVFEGDTPAPNGRLGRIPTRLTFFKLGPDSVRQYSEISADSGHTWQTSYDLTYVRRRNAPVALAASEPKSLSDADRSQIVALDSMFVRAWLRDDTAAVLGLFADDAVLVPPNAAPVVGRAAIRAWWWPQDGSRTRILAFDRHIEEIDGNHALAFVRAVATLSWTYEKKGRTTKQSSRSNDVVVLARASDGTWKIVRQIWNTRP
ncbi:MAG TPA: nuclear transport factor 2 family protein [Gemmatimonadaceae bacterium]|nr:nuclear transport factor 2 family protein [Gemmatimonadaceae bacterium]